MHWKGSLAGIRNIVLDGEIVVLDDDGLPNFQGHQKRMNVLSTQEIESQGQIIKS
jgi:ATP-dependent DNA ligase